MSLGGGETQTPVAGSNKYAEIMELMRLRQGMTPQSYTGGFNAYPVAPASSGSSSAYDELLRLQALARADRGGGRGESQEGGFRSESPMAGSGPSTFMGNLALGLDAYGNALGGFLPGGFLAQMASQAMMPSATINEAKANQALLAGLIAADPSYGGGGYGTSVASGGYGVTSPTGAGIAANPMGIDPATAQGQQAAQAQAPTMGDPNQGPQASDSGYGMTPDGGIDGSMFSKGGKVTMDRLQGPNPMGPDDGYGGLDDGEFVINAKSVGKYGIKLMNAINAGKISKGKLRGLLEA